MPLDVGLDLAVASESVWTPRVGQLRGSRVKRTIDLAAALICLIVLLPLLLLVAAVIRLESRGPALFRQRRTGYNGRPFVIYKFRTMTCLEDGDDIPQVGRGDVRVTPMGRFLRRTNVDELPQLINVLNGQMSLVGPRPHAIAHDIFYRTAVSRYDDRFLAKPGITGLAQVAGLRGPTPTADHMAARVERDLEYIRDWSLGLDMKIIAQTLMLGPLDPAAF